MPLSHQFYCSTNSEPHRENSATGTYKLLLVFKLIPSSCFYTSGEYLDLKVQFCPYYIQLGHSIFFFFKKRISSETFINHNFIVQG